MTAARTVTATLTALIVVAGCGGGETPPPSGDASAPHAASTDIDPPNKTATEEKSRDNLTTGASSTSPQPIPSDDTVPERLRIPAIGVDTGLETLERSKSGELQPPEQWQQAGWYASGPVPGDPGPAVIAGHIDSPDGPAVFAQLQSLAPGDRITVQRSDGDTVTFHVDGSQTVPQARFPTDTVYGPVPDRQLRLITCHTYDHDQGQYVDNLVVFATAESR